MIKRIFVIVMLVFCIIFCIGEEVAKMKIINTYMTTDISERLNRQAEIHRKCILILQSYHKV